MRFEKAYEGWTEKCLTQEESAQHSIRLYQIEILLAARPAVGRDHAQGKSRRHPPPSLM